jgi:hypothetical protein
MHHSAQATKAPHPVEIPEIEVALDATSVPLGSGGAAPAATRAGIMVYGNAILGSNPANQDLVIKAQLTAPNFFTVTRPRVIQLQARQADNNDFGFPDLFSMQVIETGIDFIRFRLRRMDNHANPTGWGQNLRIDVFVIDDSTEGPNPE